MTTDLFRKGSDRLKLHELRQLANPTARQTAEIDRLTAKIAKWLAQPAEVRLAAYLAKKAK